MFAADEATASNLQRFAKWAGRVTTKYKDTAKNLSNVKSAIKDIRQSSRPVTAEDVYDEANTGYKNEVLGMPTNYVYIGAGLLIVAGLGYIAYNRFKN
jgi:hypothetical protein